MPLPTTATLPVSGLRVSLRPPCGADELLLLEATDLGFATALALAARLWRPAGDAGGEPADWAGLCVTDLDSLVLRLRQMTLGDRISAEAVCPAEGCGRRIDIGFGVDQYLAHHAPAKPRGVEPGEEPGWFALPGTAVRFRLPLASDLLAVAGHPRPGRELMARCVRPAEVPARLCRRMETALAALAPPLAGELRGRCPECGSEVISYFDPQQFCLRELRDLAAFVYEDVDRLAARYHWSEPDILAMPQGRRASYAESALRQRDAG